MLSAQRTRAFDASTPARCLLSAIVTGQIARSDRRRGRHSGLLPVLALRWRQPLLLSLPLLIMLSLLRALGQIWLLLSWQPQGRPHWGRGHVLRSHTRWQPGMGRKVHPRTLHAPIGTSIQQAADDAV